jgi:hypothetical protein
MPSRRPVNGHQLPLQVKLQAMHASGELLQYVDLAVNTSRPMNVVRRQCSSPGAVCQLCCCSCQSTGLSIAAAAMPASEIWFFFYDEACNGFPSSRTC